MDINSNKIIIIKTIVGFMIQKQQNAIQKLLFIFSTKTYGLGTQKNHLNGKVLLSTQTNVKIDVKEIFHSFKPSIFSSPEPKSHG